MFSPYNQGRHSLALIQPTQLHSIVSQGLCNIVYLHRVNGMAVDRIVVRRPIVSINGPPAIPPTRAQSGIKLPIHDA